MSLEVRNLSFNYGKIPLLKDISFKVANGEFVGILGPNGSGKSTLAKNLLGILPINAGEIKIFDKEIQSYDIKSLSKIIGFVPQKSALMLPLLVKDVLLMGRYSNLQRLFASYSKADLDEVAQIAQKLRIEKFLERSILSLSGGEFQRVLLARALLKRPKILILDEPTSALDMNYAVELLNLCEGLLKSENITIIAILHDLNLASLYCEKIIFLKEGRLLYNGHTNALFTHEILKEIYNAKCEILEKNGRKFVLPVKI